MALDFGMKMEAIAQGVTGVTDEDLQALKMAEIDLSQPVSKPPTALFIGDLTLLTRGDFSCVIGQAKSRKTFLVSAMAGAYLSEEGCMGLNPPSDTGTVLWVDTEQSKFHATKVAVRVHRMAGLQTERNDERFKMLTLREYAPEDRMRLVDTAIKIYKPSLVVIDGIADLVTDVNDVKQSTELETWLLNTTKSLDIHIVGVLHTNPFSDKARGHLGSGVMRKAHTIAQVTADGDKSIVTFPYCRDVKPDDFAFCIERGLPVLTVPSTPRKLPKKAEGAFDRYTEQTSKREMAEQLMDGHGITKSTAYKWIGDALGSGILVEPQTGFCKLATVMNDAVDAMPF